MVDFALVWDDALQSADFAVANGDLVLDDGLQTAVIISLGTDRLAADDDVIPDGSGDRRGWWGDIPIDPSSSDARLYPIGSRLWLLRRAKFDATTPALAVGYVQEALQWLIDDGVASAVNVTAATQSPPLGTLLLNIAIVRNSGTASGSAVFSAQWAVALGGAPATLPAPGSLYLTDDSGSVVTDDSGNAFDVTV